MATQILNSATLQLSTDKDPSVRVINTESAMLEFKNDRRTLTVGYGGSTYGTKNGNADEAELTIRVPHGSNDNTWLIAQDAHDFPVFAGTFSCSFNSSEGAVTRIYTAKDGTIIRHGSVKLSSEDNSDDKFTDEWTIKFAKVTVS